MQVQLGKEGHTAPLLPGKDFKRKAGYQELLELGERICGMSQEGEEIVQKYKVLNVPQEKAQVSKQNFMLNVS